MKRLIVGSLVSVPLILVAACSGDPTESLRNGIVQLNASPSEIFVQQGRTAKVKVSAIDEQGNQIVTTFDASNVGSGIGVARDLTFQPVFVNDTTLQAPAEAAVFQFNVDAVDLVTTTFTLNAGGKSVDVPVTVTADPASVPAATVTTNGATAADPITVSIAAPLIFTSASAVTTDAGAGIVLSVAADGSSITFFAPPGTTTAATIDSLGLSYLPTPSGVSVTTDVPLTISTSVPNQPGTSDPTTAPDITSSPVFYDGTAFAGTDITADGGVGAQYYKFVPAADGDFTITMDAQGAGADTDVDLVLCSDVTCSDGGDFTATIAGQPESGTFSLVGGTAYYIAVILFAGATPTSISLSVQ
jgi:hypothetical protein